MRLARALLAIPLALSLAAPAAADVPTREMDLLPQPTTVHLSNGLTVLLAPDPNARLASVEVVYDVGSADDPNGRRGLAHLVEHLTMLRTAHVDAPMRFLESIGASRFNAQTSPDRTRYFESVPPERLENVLWLASDQMGFASQRFTEGDLSDEKRVVANEDDDRMKDSTSATRTAMQHAIYPAWHPYASVADGAADLPAIDLSDALAFRATWYTPSNAVLAIAGRFDLDSTIARVKHYFESLPSRRPPVRQTLPDWASQSIRLGLAAPIPVNQAGVAFRTPPFGEHDDAALDLAALVLAGRGNTRLQRSLVAEGLALGVQARQASERRASLFTVVAQVAPGAVPAAVNDAIQQAIDDLARTVTDADVQRARAIWQDERLAALETTWGRAARLASMARIGVVPGGAGEPFDWGLSRYETLTSADVATAVRTWLDPHRRLAVIVLSDRAAPRAGRLLVNEVVTP